MVKVLWMTLNPHHDFRIDTGYLTDLHWQENTFRDFVSHPLNKILSAAAGEKFVTHPVDTEHLIFPVMMKQVFPETGQMSKE